MHIAQNLIPMPNNQDKQYRCSSFPGSFAAGAKQSGSPGGFDVAQTREDQNPPVLQHHGDQIYPRAMELLCLPQRASP